MSGDVNKRPFGSRTTPSCRWDPQQIMEGNECCAFCGRLGLRPSEIALLIHGEDFVGMECIKPATVELYHTLMLDIVSLNESKDDQDRKVFGMMVEESTMLFLHALDEDMNAWNRLRSAY